MAIFTRLRDIISSNINAMLDKAEDPEKLIKLMIFEMEDTLMEIKAACAGAMATRKKISRHLEESRERVRQWEDRAVLAVDKGKEDLAREALYQKRKYEERTQSLESERTQCETLLEQYKEDIAQLEEKLNTVREKQRLLIQRHIHASSRTKAEKGIRKADTTDAFVRFEKIQQKVDKMEAEADLVNFGRKPALEDEFTKLEVDQDIEAELTRLKEKARGRSV